MPRHTLNKPKPKVDPSPEEVERERHFQALLNIVKQRPPMRSIEDNRYQQWWLQADQIVKRIEGS